MTDYWKSNPRKFCNFCKCWISDNKASIAAHESGKRHQMSVAKRLSDISIQSEKDERERQKMDAEIRKMEEAAMRSYAQDIHSQLDMTARNVSAVMTGPAPSAPSTSTSRIQEQVDDRSEQSSSTMQRRQIDPLRLMGDDEAVHGEKFRYYRPGPTKVTNSSAEESVGNASLWVEAKTEDNYTYYWNVKTNESVWEKPKEGYLSWKEFQKINEIAIQQEEVQKAEEAKQFQKNVPEMLARYNRERFKLRRPEVKGGDTLKNDAQQQIHETADDDGTTTDRSNFRTEEDVACPPIGQWQTVETKPIVTPPPIDLCLPKVKQPPKYVPIVFAPPKTSSNEITAPAPERFKERVIDRLDPEVAANTSASFKKRKISSKRNTRQRLDADD